jgi:hypothetical protein
MPAQFSQGVIGDSHPIIFCQTKATARQPHTTERECDAVSKQLAFSKAHSQFENGSGTWARMDPPHPSSRQAPFIVGPATF